MKRIFSISLLVLFGFASAFGQWSGYMADDGTTTLDGGIGMTWIDDQAYYNISFMPDISIGKLGVGLNLSLLYNVDTGHIRSEDWDSGYDYARVIRYVRWGHKGDRFYTRVGALDAARIGHGFILGYYNNQINYDERKIGLSLVTIIISHVAFNISFVAVVVRARLVGFDRSLEEAAQDLGANELQTFWHVTLPLLMPAILGGGLLAFTLSLDDFVITFFTAGVGSTTLPLRIYSMVKLGITPEINAISTLLLVASMTLVMLSLFFQRKGGGSPADIA